MVLGTKVVVTPKVVIVIALVDMVEPIVQKKNVKIMVVGIAIPVMPEVAIVVVPVVMAELIVQ